MWPENYEIIELKGSSKLDHSVKSYYLFTNVNTFTGSHCFKLKNGNSVILMPLDRVLPIVWSSASWMMRSGHSNSQVAPWSLGHRCGALFLKSGVPASVQWSPSWWWRTRPVWNCAPETIPPARSLLLQTFVDFYVPNFMHQIPFLIQILRVVLISWQELCLIHLHWFM